MTGAVINRSIVKKNRELKKIQKRAGKYYGRVWKASGKRDPKTKINKVVDVTAPRFVSLVKEETREQEGRIPKTLDQAELILKCREYGLTGRSGNGFLTADKLEAFGKKTGREGRLLINGVECDPGLVHDAWLYRNEYQRIRTGVSALKQCFSVKEVYLATREPELREDRDIVQVGIPNRYPAGYENFLLKHIWNIELKEGERPLDRGILVLNLQTVLEIGEIALGRYIPERYLTAADLTTGKSAVVRAELGQRAQDVLLKAFPEAKGKTLFVGSGAMESRSMGEEDVIDGRSSFLAFGEAPDYEAASRCKGCGACSANCPQKIQVHKIVQALEKGQNTDLSAFHPERCIGCGACTYGCRAGKNIQAMMAQINAKK